ncbi:MAG: hypothetical protein GC136_09700 [Alphaproteobacteria bacterium]|nr:hypothetical protein [Alphaproteobacteria bacterium]
MTKETTDAADLESSAALVLEKIGLTTEEAVKLFYRQIVIHNGLPFGLRASSERPARGDRDDRPPRKFDRDSRPPRRDGPPSRGGPRKSFGDRDERPRRFDRDDGERRPRGDKPDFKKKRDFDRDDDGPRSFKQKKSTGSQYHGWRKDDSKPSRGAPKKRFNKGK